MQVKNIFNKWIIQIFKSGIILLTVARMKQENQVLINCSEMTVNYTIMHCNTLHYTVEYTATHCSSDNKTRPNNS